MKLTLNTHYLEPYITQQEMESLEAETNRHLESLFAKEDPEGVKGWVDTADAAVQLDLIQEKAAEIRAHGDVFVLVGVGGSNQAARAATHALQEEDGPQVLYGGNTLSPHYLASLLRRLEGKSVYINVIAKNFETLEPGSHFRVLRAYMAERYSPEEMSRRVVLTGTEGSPLHQIAQDNGFTFLQFPKRIGGRYSAFSPVGLLPMAVAGLDVGGLLAGVGRAQQTLCQGGLANPAVAFAIIRKLLYHKGYNIEVLASFEPQLAFFSRWWTQLFGESEGKDNKGIFPAAVTYSEDLHSMGQYMQEGRRNLFETFLSLEQPTGSVVVQPDPLLEDGFDYLNGKDFAAINRIAEQATIQAHGGGGVPCVQLVLPTLDAGAFGELFYFFMVVCALSSRLLGVNPFDQEGVEAYKQSMFAALGKL